MLLCMSLTMFLSMSHVCILLKLHNGPLKMDFLGPEKSSSHLYSVPMILEPVSLTTLTKVST